MLKNKFFWIIAFTLIMTLAVLFLFMERDTELGWLGIPGWIYSFLWIELIYCGMMAVFIRYFWAEEKGDKSA